MATETALVDVGVLFTAVALAGVLSSRIDQSVIPFTLSSEWYWDRTYYSRR
ncbi:hypothetical protein [Natrinema sp. SYSU A 869]|uniref:hypothetical protein n=1 Tax=Natrinema sp. SYSU A 869 TaxID=2871694 RepID=UPI0021073F45|nr:hypothetical protein [Natrinema sp. SYSU A 869]